MKSKSHAKSPCKPFFPLLRKPSDRPKANSHSLPCKRFSLTGRMIQVFLCAWVAPVLFVTVFGGVLLLNRIVVQSEERLLHDVEEALYMQILRLENAIEDSRETSYRKVIRDAWRKYSDDGDTVTLFDTSRTFLTQQYEYDDNFKSTVLLYFDFPDEPIYVINSSAGGTDRIRRDADAIFAKALAYSATLDTQIAFFRVGDRVLMMRNLVNAKYEPFAVLLTVVNTDLILTDLQQITDLVQGCVFINDVRIPLVGDNPQDVVNERIAEMTAKTTEASQEITAAYHGGSIYFCARYESSDYQVSFYGITKPQILRQQWRFTLIIFSVIVLLMIPLGALSLCSLMRWVMHPLQAFARLAEEIGAEHYGKQLPAELLQSKEIGALGDNFNQMSTTLKQQFEHIYKEQVVLRDAKIMALQSQINPHFLNNTLEIINWEARMQGNLRVCDMLESLSTLLTAAMDRKNRPVVHLAEELMYVDAYLHIIRERLGQRLIFVKNIPERMLDYNVPRLILQPILENAVEHAITPVQHGQITLSATIEGDWLLLSVENDGALHMEDLVRIQRVLREDYAPENLGSGSLGLRNVHQRLRILYGEEAGVLVDITKKDKTVFQLRVKLS